MILKDCEDKLAGFKPSFEFVPPMAISEDEYKERIKKLRRLAQVSEHDVLLVNANGVVNYHVTNKYLRWLTDWNREGILIVPTDESKGLILYTIYTQAVILPPAWGEAVGIDEIYQVGALGREYSGRPSSSEKELRSAVAGKLTELGYASASIGLIGDGSSHGHWQALKELLPHADWGDETSGFLALQKYRTPAEIDQIRASTQLMEIGFEAACYICRPGVTDNELYAAFTYAQLARGGENADGYQIGVNRWGTHCGKAYGHVVEPGDLINFYVSGISYRGYTGQIARMIAVGDITDKQEECLWVCEEAVRRAEKLLRPGVRVCDVNNAAFEPYIEKGYLTSPDTRKMTYNWAPQDDLTPIRVKEQYIPCPEIEQYGRKLTHVYPVVKGPHNPNLGHGVGMHGDPDKFNFSSYNFDIMQPGLCFVMHPQWLDPMVCGANVGNCYAITEDGYENLSPHTPIETIRIKA